MCPDLNCHRAEATDFWLSKTATEGLLAHLSMRQAQEYVGVLIGTSGYAINAIRLLNSTAGPESFRIEAFELARASRCAAKQGQQIIALYHSHPMGDFNLSNKDRYALERSYWPWLIVALENNNLHCYGYAAVTCKLLRIVFE